MLGWLQLRQYSSPLTGARTGGQLGIDPLLAATPTLGVLAGAVLALRVLPPLTRLAERYVDRKPWTATMFGMWQAGRRPHAGPVLLLALAVAVSTLAWCLASTSERSLVDQAGHQVGTDLRLVETNGFPPDGRAAALADAARRPRRATGVAGESAAGPGRGAGLGRRARHPRRGGPGPGPGRPGRLGLRRRSAARGRPAARRRPVHRTAAWCPEALRRRARRDPGSGLATTSGPTPSSSSRAAVIRRVPLGTSGDDQSLRFTVDLPAGATPLRLAGFVTDALGAGRHAARLDAHVSCGAGAGDAAGTPVDLSTGGGVADRGPVRPAECGASRRSAP